MHHTTGFSSGGLSILSGLFFLVIVAAVSNLFVQRGDGEIRPLSQHRTVIVAADPDLAPMLEVVAARFSELRRDSRVRIDALSSTAALDELARGRVQLAIAAREPDATDTGTTTVLLARDGVTLLVHQSNSIMLLSDADMSDMYTGRLQNWKMVGGEDQGINMIKRAAGRGETEIFLKHLKLDNIPRRIEPVRGSSEQVIRAIAVDPGAVGIVSVATAQRAIARGVPVKLLSVHGIAPSAEAIQNGTFPVAMPVNMFLPAHATDTAREFAQVVSDADARSLFAARQYATAP